MICLSHRYRFTNSSSGYINLTAIDQVNVTFKEECAMLSQSSWTVNCFMEPSGTRCRINLNVNFSAWWLQWAETVLLQPIHAVNELTYVCHIHFKWNLAGAGYTRGMYKYREVLWGVIYFHKCMTASFFFYSFFPFIFCDIMWFWPVVCSSCFLGSSSVCWHWFGNARQTTAESNYVMKIKFGWHTKSM